jgi:TetR/AcrR family transcriptional repressor of nem operon
MRVTRDQAEKNRATVVETASRLFRERGFGGVGVADIMKSAGLTHGGFYGQFGSKDDLAREASEHALAASKESWKRLSEGLAPEAALDAIIRFYLSPEHRDQPAGGCAMAALAVDAGRQEQPVRAAFTAGLSSAIRFLSDLLPGRSKAARREKSLAAFSTMVGALILSRAVDDADLSEEILNAAKAMLGVTAPVAEPGISG